MSLVLVSICLCDYHAGFYLGLGSSYLTSIFTDEFDAEMSKEVACSDGCSYLERKRLDILERLPIFLAIIDDARKKMPGSPEIKDILTVKEFERLRIARRFKIESGDQKTLGLDVLAFAQYNTHSSASTGSDTSLELFLARNEEGKFDTCESVYLLYSLMGKN